MISAVNFRNTSKSIRPEIYPARIVRKWIPNFYFGTILAVFGRFSGPPGRPGKISGKARIARKNGRSAVRENTIFRR